MPAAVIDGIETRYEVMGSGPPVLMFSPGGFDATVEKWGELGIYRRLRFLDHLPRHYTCIVFDRRETGHSGGRVERVGWSHYARQGKGLLDHLGISRAHVMGGCMGCSVALAFSVAYPQAAQSLVLFWPVGGARYRLNGHRRFAAHLAYVHEKGLDGVVELAGSQAKSFGDDPRGGPWVSVLRRDGDFAEAFRRLDVERYKFLVAGMGRTLLDRDTAPGAEAEDLLGLDVPALIIPGADATHATSAARYLGECLPLGEYWDIPVGEQGEETVPPRVLAFLEFQRL